MERVPPNFADGIKEAKKQAMQRGTSAWEGEVIYWAASWTIDLKHEYPDDIPQDLLLPPNVPAHLGRMADVLQSLILFNRQIFETPDLALVPKLVSQKYNYMLAEIRDLKRRGDYVLIARLGGVVGGIRNRQRMSELTYKLTNLDETTLYFLTCREDRFLVGTRDGECWKNVSLPTDPDERWMAATHLSSHYLQTLGLVGRREAPYVPDSFISSEDVKRINLPTSARSLEDLLEDAYFKQRYIIPVEGAEVRFRKAGDLEKILLVQSRNLIFSRFVTSLGEAVVCINTDDAIWTSPDIRNQEIPTESRWATILAEVYHDMVTAVEVPTARFRRLRPSNIIDEVSEDGEEEEDLGPEVIYIPRKVRTGHVEPRIPYEGPIRPVRPHRVVGYRRKGNMSERQRMNILQLEQQLGINILEFVPEGETFVRPHVSPREAALGFSSLPVFIKRRIETQLAERLRVRVDDYTRNLPPQRWTI